MKAASLRVAHRLQNHKPFHQSRKNSQWDQKRKHLCKKKLCLRLLLLVGVAGCVVFVVEDRLGPDAAAGPLRLANHRRDCFYCIFTKLLSDVQRRWLLLKQISRACFPSAEQTVFIVWVKKLCSNNIVERRRSIILTLDYLTQMEFVWSFNCYQRNHLFQ